MIQRSSEESRWKEEWSIRRFEAEKNNQPILSQRERIWKNSELRYQQNKALKSLKLLSSKEFKQKIADAFKIQGYITSLPSRKNYSMEIYTSVGNLHAVALCKLYKSKSKITSTDICTLVDACLLMEIKRGYLFTTAKLTLPAKRETDNYPWLKVYSDLSLAQYIHDHFDRKEDDM